MTTSLGKRSSINGISDIAYTIQKAPVNTSGDQFIQGVKTFSQSINAFGNILCSGKYYGDGSQLKNLPIVNDPSKLPLAGGTMTGDINMADNDILAEKILSPSISVNSITNGQSINMSRVENVGGPYNMQITATEITAQDQDPNVTAQFSNSLLSFSNTNQDSYGKFARTYLQFEEGTGDTNTQSATQIQLQNGSFSHTLTALYQTFNDGNGNSNEIDNIKVFIREDGGGKDATYGLLSSQHRNENNFNSCLTEVGVNTDGNLGLSVKSQMDVDACTLFVGYNAGIPAQPEVSVSGNSFIKWNTGTSLRIRQQDGNRIEKWDAVQVNNGAYGQFVFHDYTHYLDAYGEGGWTVTLINPGNLPDPNVNSPDIYFVGSQIGGVTNNFTLLKWTAARFILTPTTPGIYPYDFVWLVSF